MGNVFLSIPRELALRLKAEYGLSTLIETGTYKCGTAGWAAAHFEQVYTIEGYRTYYDANVKAHHEPNLHMIFGDSRAKLPEVLAQVTQPALIWLDAHFLGNSEESAGTDGECPIKEELDALRACGVRHFILIDDEHCFNHIDLPKLSHRNLWPSLDTVIGWLPPGYYATTFEDVIICVPMEAKEIVEDYKKYPTVRIIVPTSNDYVHALPGFAYLINKHWPNQSATVLRYDVRPPKLPGNFYAQSLGDQSDWFWSEGLRAYVERYAPSLFILMLEDYYLKNDVNAAAVVDLWHYMIEHPEVAKIDLTGDRMKVPHGEPFDAGGVQVVKSDDTAAWQTSIQAAIWRKDFFLRFATLPETPWQFEKAGTRRVIAARNGGLFDGHILGTVEPLLDYVNAIGGMGTQAGQYDRKKFPPALWNELAEKGLVR